MARDFSEMAMAVERMLAVKKLNYVFERGIFIFAPEIDESPIDRINYKIETGINGVMAYGLCPLIVPKSDRKKMFKMSYFISMANDYISASSKDRLLFDREDGGVKFRHFVDRDRVISLSPNELYEAILKPAHMFKNYGLGIIDVISGGDAEDAVMHCIEQQLKDLDKQIEELRRTGRIDDIFGI